MIKTKEKVRAEIEGNGQIPTYINIEAVYWEKECRKARQELANANRGISRLVKGKDNYKTRNIATLLQQAHAHGVIEGTTKALADNEGEIIITEKYNIKKGGE